MEKVRWGIIGCGAVTEVKSGPAFQQAEGSELVAVMRRNGALAKDYAERHGVPRWYDDADRLLADPEVDAVYVATPPDSHMKYTLKAALAGKPVYVEKPMARNESECIQMIQACEAAGVPLFVAYYRRMQPRFLKIKELLDSGAIGDVRFVHNVFLRTPTPYDPSTSWRLKPEVGGGGLFPDLASHTLDLLDYFLGPVRRATGMAGNQSGRFAVEDIVTMAFEFESGAMGTGVWCFEAAAAEDRCEIVGSRGKITFATFADEPVRLTTPESTQEWLIPQPKHVQLPLIQSVVDELRGRGARCPSTGRSALRTNRTMDAVLATYYFFSPTRK
ncbi:Gfo/Idh/MocA family oxidoreductase [Paenibacillus sp.]|uniref:Gfo/Idh/MocA family protein n=1 Tax=Paenibacillus sp. TaxID=58172 RepID=UPI002D6CBA89|nr:Gfo/Idh/MocA family oxidoreductase [Paenibacillus sp.]HZG56075.1 Gfo/Idh/MocA family oxidoreductase [Paenibacillus sp.]